MKLLREQGSSYAKFTSGLFSSQIVQKVNLLTAGDKGKDEGLLLSPAQILLALWKSASFGNECYHHNFL